MSSSSPLRCDFVTTLLIFYEPKPDHNYFQPSLDPKDTFPFLANLREFKTERIIDAYSARNQ